METEKTVAVKFLTSCKELAEENSKCYTDLVEKWGSDPESAKPFINGFNLCVTLINVLLEVLKR